MWQVRVGLGRGFPLRRLQLSIINPEFRAGTPLRLPAMLTGPAEVRICLVMIYFISASASEASGTCWSLALLAASQGCLKVLLFAGPGSPVPQGLVSQAASSPSSAPSVSSLASVGHQEPIPGHPPDTVTSCCCSCLIFIYLFGCVRC